MLVYLWLALSYILYQLGLLVYRLYFHPLAKFPGPKLAGASYLYELLLDFFVGQGGELINQVEDLHDKYGPIIRVTPDEVHIRDPEWAHVLYAGHGSVRDKDPSLAHAAGTADGTFGTISHYIHRRRRAPVSTYFSRYSTEMYMYDKIWERSGKMCDVLQQHHHDNSVVRGRALFLGWSNDTLRICAFDECLDLVYEPDRAMVLDGVLKAFAAFYPILKQCEWIIPTALELPIAPFRYILKPLGILLTVHQTMIDYAEKACIQREYEKPELTKTEVSKGSRPRGKTLYQALLLSSLPEEDKRPKRMAHEGFEIMLAGSDTTARAMMVACYHIMANPHVTQTLHEELRTVMPDPHQKVELKVLESLPYLNAIIKEMLRIGKITDHRLSLVAPEENLQYGEWIIPAGTRVSMTPTRHSLDPRYFPDPYRFAPERWLQPEEAMVAMNRVFMPFAYGRRACLGMHFAQAELRVGIAKMFRQFEFEIYDTIRERDIDHTWAHIAGEPSKKGKGLRFKVTKILD